MRSKVKTNHRSCGTRLAAALAMTGCLGGCSVLSPAARFEESAHRAGLQPGAITGAGFQHRTFTARAPDSAVRGPLHIYFDGDGTPFVRRDRIAADPTSRTPLTLKLIAADPHQAVLVGRPCYHGLTDGCDPTLWTVARYSEAVVASMAAATLRLIEGGAFDQVVIIGYSGGGVLALLVAERLQQVDAVVTVAANLDLEAWTRLHRYSKLTGSIDPARAPALRSDLRQLHLTGDRDDNVPPWLQQGLAARAGTELRVFAGFDHRCCWVAVWPEPLAEIDRWLLERAQAFGEDASPGEGGISAP